MRPETLKMTPGQTYRLDGYEGFNISAVSTLPFSAVLEGQVQADPDNISVRETEWFFLANLSGNGLYPYATQLPFVRVRVTSGTPVLHLQKLERLPASPGVPAAAQPTLASPIVMDYGELIAYSGPLTKLTVLRGGSAGAWERNDAAVVDNILTVAGAQGSKWSLVRPEAVPRYLTPEQFLALGDEIADDSLALYRFARAMKLTNQGGRISKRHRVGPNAYPLGPLTFQGLPNVELVFAPGAAIVLDDLVADPQNLGKKIGSGASGVYISGPTERVSITGLNVEWKELPFRRAGGGYGLCVRGSSSRTGNYVKNVTVNGATVKRSPEGGMIFLGVDGPTVTGDVYIEDTWADGCHFNGCCRPKLVRIVGKGVLDDLAPLVTYKGPDGPLGGPLAAGADGPYTPFQKAALGEFSNAGAEIGEVLAYGGTGNAVRLNGVNGARIRSIYIENRATAVTCNGAKQNLPGNPWEVGASKGVIVSSIVADGCAVPVVCILENATKTAGNEAYYQMDLRIDKLITRNTVGDSVQVLSVDGVRFGSIVADKRVLFDTTDNCGFDALECAGQLTVTGAGTFNIGKVRAKRIELTNIVSLKSNGERWTTENSDSDALYMAGIAACDAPGADLLMPNRTGGSSARAATVANVRNWKGELRIRTDARAFVPLEIGGGDATSQSRNLNLKVYVDHTRASNDLSAVYQGGAYGPQNTFVELVQNNGSGPSRAVFGTDPTGAVLYSVAGTFTTRQTFSSAPVFANGWRGSAGGFWDFGGTVAAGGVISSGGDCYSAQILIENLNSGAMASFLWQSGQGIVGTPMGTLTVSSNGAANTISVGKNSSTNVLELTNKFTSAQTLIYQVHGLRGAITL